jgi:hypothetical protein
MLEKLWDNRPFKLGWIFHNKRFSVVGPAGYLRVTSIDHMIGFCKVKGEALV